MTRLILNAAMIPCEGTFRYRNISAADAAAWLREHGPTATSYVGYPQTADHIAAIGGVRCALNREKCAMSAGDEALVVKLAYRVNPALKGQPMPEDWEYGVLERRE
jgi:Domain of unknown function (DUF1874)